jgi:hypothetical protein
VQRRRQSRQLGRVFGVEDAADFLLVLAKPARQFTLAPAETKDSNTPGSSDKKCPMINGSRPLQLSEITGSRAFGAARR